MHMFVCLYALMYVHNVCLCVRAGEPGAGICYPTHARGGKTQAAGQPAVWRTQRTLQGTQVQAAQRSAHGHMTSVFSHMTSHMMMCVILTGSSSSDGAGKGGPVSSTGGRKMEPPVLGGSPVMGDSPRSKVGGAGKGRSQQQQQPTAVDLLLDLQVSGRGRGVSREG